jgi:hypothetical protein
MNRRGALGLLACLPLSLRAAPPQTVYRCGPEGRIYSQTPCADGKALTVDDPRSAEQQKAAREVSARDAEQARQLAAERRQREAAARQQAAAGVKPEPPAESASAARKKKGKAPATDPSISPPMRVPAPATASR